MTTSSKRSHDESLEKTTTTATTTIRTGLKRSKTYHHKHNEHHEHNHTPADLLQIICVDAVLFDYLPLDTALCVVYLRSGTWSVPPILARICATRIKEQLAERLGLGDDFIEIWRKNNSDGGAKSIFLSGSFLLQACLQEDWSSLQGDWRSIQKDAGCNPLALFDLRTKPTDIDWFKLEEYTWSTITPFTEHLWNKCLGRPKSEVRQKTEVKPVKRYGGRTKVYDTKFAYESSTMYGNTIINNIRNYRLKCLHINDQGSSESKYDTRDGNMNCQLICVSTPKKDVFAWIKDYFDFSFLCNTFDGHHVQIAYPEAIARRMNLPKSTSRIQLFADLSHYGAHFKDNNYDMALEHLEKKKLKALKRAVTYTSRGFNI